MKKLGHFVGFHQIGNHENFIFTKKVARQPYFFFFFSNSPLNSTTDVKKLENSMKGLLLWKTVEIALKTHGNVSISWLLIMSDKTLETIKNEAMQS